MGFKEDADFARFLTMGAYGTAAVKADLEQRGHRIIELERYSMANKVWSIKVKRLRIPDLLCVDCGLRIESRAKTRLEIKLSDSTIEGREWHSGGMRDSDLYAFARIVLSDEMPRIGPPRYFDRAALASVALHAKRSIRKSAAQGSEVDLSWSSWVPSYGGRVVGLDRRKVHVRTSSSGQRSFDMSKWPASGYLYLEPGDQFSARDTIVAGIVPPANTDCGGQQWNIADDLKAVEVGNRYAAVKATKNQAAPHFARLSELTDDADEDWRIRLEAMASLAGLESSRWIGKLATVATDLDAPVEQQMEAVLILAEIPDEMAIAALCEAAQPHRGREDELRAAALWGVGTGALPSRQLSCHS